MIKRVLQKFFEKNIRKYFATNEKRFIFASLFQKATSGSGQKVEEAIIGRLAQLVQSICLTSRGSAVRIRQRPPLQSSTYRSFDRCFFFSAHNLHTTISFHCLVTFRHQFGKRVINGIIACFGHDMSRLVLSVPLARCNRTCANDRRFFAPNRSPPCYGSSLRNHRGDRVE